MMEDGKNVEMPKMLWKKCKKNSHEPKSNCGENFLLWNALRNC
jgi:hypothetical protein